MARSDSKASLMKLIEGGSADPDALSSDEGERPMSRERDPTLKADCSRRRFDEDEETGRSSVSREIPITGKQQLHGFGLHDTVHESMKQVYHSGSNPGHESMKQVYRYDNNPFQDSFSRRVYSDGRGADSVKRTYGFPSRQQGLGPDSVQRRHDLGTGGGTHSVRQTYNPARSSYISSFTHHHPNYHHDEDDDDNSGLIHAAKSGVKADQCLSCYEGVASGHTEWCETLRKDGKKMRQVTSGLIGLDESDLSSFNYNTVNITQGSRIW